jgi:hypothetical protein
VFCEHDIIDGDDDDAIEISNANLPRRLFLDLHGHTITVLALNFFGAVCVDNTVAQKRWFVNFHAMPVRSLNCLLCRAAVVLKLYFLTHVHFACEQLS